jgi:hypothetical protein
MMMCFLRAQIARAVMRFAFPLLAVWDSNHAHAQGKLDVTYSISFAKIPVGEMTATVVVGEGAYTISAVAHGGGVLKVLSLDGKGSFAARGTIKDGLPVATYFTSKMVSNVGTSEVAMVLDEGSVSALSAAPPPSPERVSVTNANRRGIVDPLTSLLISASTSGEIVSRSCHRTLPIFDGNYRYDLKLAFKRLDRVTAETGYTGPVVVCSVMFEPIAGHSATMPLLKYLTEGRDIEMTFAPIAGIPLLMPLRLSVASMLANLIIEASRFEMTAHATDTSSDLQVTK